jgi:hypothetical protein
MIVEVSKQITRRDSIIIESFSFSPKNKIRLFWQEGSRIKDFLVFVTDLLSIKEEYKLVETKEYQGSIINKYSFQENKKIPNPSLVYRFSYIPFLGKKKCKKCFFVRRAKNGSLYCSGRLKKIKGDFWNNCLYYYENSLIIEKDDQLVSLIDKIYY